MTEHEFKLGDDVLAWDDHAVTKARGKFISCVPYSYPFYVLLADGIVEKFANCIPYKAPAMRSMIHKEVFELMARESVVFRHVGMASTGAWVISHWDSSLAIADFEYCPIAELVEPLIASPWRKLEVEE